MKETDYIGLSHFQEFCKDLDEHYVVVGGFATLMLLDNEIPNHGKVSKRYIKTCITSYWK